MTSVPTARQHLAAQLSMPLRRYLSTEAGGATILVVAVLVALVWANSPASGAYEALWSAEGVVRVGPAGLDMSLHHWVNDGLMVVFFFVIGLEVRRDLAVGELTDRRRVVLPVLAGIGGMVVPAAVYLLVTAGTDAGHGWGTVIGTDTAFVLGALALVGPRVSTQLRIFLLTLTVVDDIVAVSVIGVVYSNDLDVRALAVAAVAVVGLVALDRFGVWRSWPYGSVVIVLWLATLASGVHASIAGMVAGLLVPAFLPRRQAVEGAARLFHAFRQSPGPDAGLTVQAGVARSISVNERMQAVLHPWTSYVIVPVFALANAGVDLRGGVLADALGSRVTWGVVLGLVVGKTLGISLGALGGARLGAGRLPQGVGAGHVVGGAALSGIGFTVSLLIIELAFGDSVAGDEARVGVLLSAVLAVGLGAAVFRVAAVWRGETDATLPLVLDRPVDPERDHVRGPAGAPLTLVEYGDFECPFCAKATGVTRELVTHYGESLRYVFRHLPLPDVHPHAEQAALAAEAAARQGRFWQMHDRLFAHPDELEIEDLVGHADRIGLDVERFVRDLEDPDLARAVRDDVASAEASGARGTPTFFVGDRRHLGAHDTATLIAALDASRAATPDRAGDVGPTR